MFVRVRYVRRTEDNTETLTFQIEEGPSIKVRSIDFVGNQKISTSRLKAVARTKEYSWLTGWGLREGGYATVRQVELDADHLNEFYKRNGFEAPSVSAEISSDRTSWTPTKGFDLRNQEDWRLAREIHVRFHVQEGPRPRISHIAFSTQNGKDLPVDAARLRDLLRTREGHPLYPGTVKSDTRRLERALNRAGYLKADAEPSLHRDDAGHEVRWHLNLGPKAKLKWAFFRGNFATYEKTIWQWLPFRKNDYLSSVSITRAQRNLALNQLFNNARPLTFMGLEGLDLGISDTNGDLALPMLVEVEERNDNWGTVRIGGGASTEQAPPTAPSLTVSSHHWVTSIGTSLAWAGRLSDKARWATMSRGPRPTSSSRAFWARFFAWKWMYAI